MNVIKHKLTATQLKMVETIQKSYFSRLTVSQRVKLVVDFLKKC